MTIERNNINHLMWRKKVDNSVFEGETVIPIAFVKSDLNFGETTLNHVLPSIHITPGVGFFQTA